MWIDVTVPLRAGMPHWPGDPPVRVRTVASISRGAECNLTALSMCVHVATHMDAPSHYLPEAASIDAMPLDATIGRARVVEIADPEAIEPRELRRHRIQRGERILFRTRNSERCWKVDHFTGNFVHITPDAAQFLAARGVRAVGVDYLSVGSPGPEGAETHRLLLSAGVWIIEGLDLSHAPPGTYEMVCLPLKILGADGAPARVILKRRRSP